MSEPRETHARALGREEVGQNREERFKEVSTGDGSEILDTNHTKSSFLRRGVTIVAVFRPFSRWTVTQQHRRATVRVKLGENPAVPSGTASKMTLKVTF